MHRRGALALLLALAACAAPQRGLPPARDAAAARRAADVRYGTAIGFEIDTPQLVALAAKQGIQAAILYDRSPAANTALARAFVAHNMRVIDGGIASELFYWECHRTHTVARPPGSDRNDYCRTDEEPRIDSDAVVLADVAAMLARDARRPYVAGYWVLDDWPWWDYGSARTLLQKIHAEIAQTGGLPAICGFGAAIEKGRGYGWGAGLAKNFSPAGCDAVGWYNYTPFGLRHPSSGDGYNWSMHGLLHAMARSLERYGWNVQAQPLIGIGQAWGGSYGSRSYQPGLSAAQMEEQARAFCRFGASSIAWYSWNDSGFNAQTQTPVTSHAVADGIRGGIGICRSIWTIAR